MYLTRGHLGMITKLRKLSTAIQEIFGTSPNDIGTTTLSATTGGIVTEVVIVQSDDIGVLIGLLLKMGLQEVLDKHIPKHWKQRELSWGWTIVIWLAYVIRCGDHRKISMEETKRKCKIR